MKRPLRLIVVALMILAVTAPAAAADTGWAIETFRADLAIRPNGNLNIVEAIEVDFRGLEKHGIFRVIPTRYRFDERRDRTYGIFVDGVTDAAGRPLLYQVTTADAATEIKIGDPGRTVSGKQSYRIRYTITGALNAFDDHDELYWNVNGDRWEVPTGSASATVTVPGTAVQRVTCFQGPLGSTEPCTTARSVRGSAGTSTAEFASRSLAPGEQLSVVVSLAKGAVSVAPPTLVAHPRGFADYFSTSPVALGVAAAVLAGGLWAVWWLWWSRGRDRGRPRGAIVPEYEPPAKLRPAQLGVLVDESADSRDLVATIVDLAVRGYLMITEHPKEGLFGHADWTLDKKKAGDDLLPYERRLFEGLFTGGDSVLLSSLKGTFSLTLKGAESLLYTDATERGWFVADPSGVRVRYAGLGCLTSAAGIGLTFLLGRTLGWGLAGAALVPVGAVLLVMNRAMPARTAAGAALFAQTLGVQALHGDGRDRPREVRGEGRAVHGVPPVRRHVRDRRSVDARVRGPRHRGRRLELLCRSERLQRAGVLEQLRGVLQLARVDRRFDARRQRRERLLRWRRVLRRRRWWRRRGELVSR